MDLFPQIPRRHSIHHSSSFRVPDSPILFPHYFPLSSSGDSHLSSAPLSSPTVTPPPSRQMSSFDSRVQVRFLQDSSLSLVHIPLTLYPHFLDALITLLVPDAARNGKFFGRTEIFEFINISLTPVECSVVCPRDVTEKFFKPIIEDLSPELKNTVSISPEDFVAIQVEGEELNAGQRVLDLSSPLALVGVYVDPITLTFSLFLTPPSSPDQSSSSPPTSPTTS